MVSRAKTQANFFNQQKEAEEPAPLGRQNTFGNQQPPTSAQATYHCTKHHNGSLHVFHLRKQLVSKQTGVSQVNVSGGMQSLISQKESSNEPMSTQYALAQAARESTTEGSIVRGSGGHKPGAVAVLREANRHSSASHNQQAKFKNLFAHKQARHDSGHPPLQDSVNRDRDMQSNQITVGSNYMAQKQFKRNNEAVHNTNQLTNQPTFKDYDSPSPRAKRSSPSGAKVMNSSPSPGRFDAEPRIMDINMLPHDNEETVEKLDHTERGSPAGHNQVLHILSQSKSSADGSLSPSRSLNTSRLEMSRKLTKVDVGKKESGSMQGITDEMSKQQAPIGTLEDGADQVSALGPSLPARPHDEESQPDPLSAGQNLQQILMEHNFEAGGLRAM